MPVGEYQQLRVWQGSMDLVVAVYRIARVLPREETYTLGQQMRRSAASIPANIAEGHARRSKREYLHFISVALGSLAELETQLWLVDRLGMGLRSELEPALLAADEVGRMLRGLEAAISARLARCNSLPDRLSPIAYRRFRDA
jgi:four helix bundle protein